jgi:subtilisin family serine protease
VSVAAVGTGRGIRVAVVDSGVFEQHPHIGRIAGGVGIDADGHEHPDYVDRLGHGTAVAAAIHELAPDADLYAVKVFDTALSARIASLAAGIAWAVRMGADVINLSLGTPKLEHESILRAAIDNAAARGAVLVSARDDEGVKYLPGSLAGVVGVQVDWSLARGEYRVVDVDARAVVRASGLPRPIPGVPPARNLHGVSFAVANASAFVARAMEGTTERSVDAVVERLRRTASG